VNQVLVVLASTVCGNSPVIDEVHREAQPQA
jgi:hypothetical protein